MVVWYLNGSKRCPTAYVTRSGPWGTFQNFCLTIWTRPSLDLMCSSPVGLDFASFPPLDPLDQFCVALTCKSGQERATVDATHRGCWVAGTRLDLVDLLSLLCQSFWESWTMQELEV